MGVSLLYWQGLTPMADAIFRLQSDAVVIRESTICYKERCYKNERSVYT